MSTRRSFLMPLVAGAAAILFGVAVGTVLLDQRGSQRVPVTSDPRPTPATTFDPASPAASATPRGPTETLRVFFARDELPPVGVGVRIEVNEGPTVAGYTRARLRALASAAPPSGLVNVLASSRTKPVVGELRVEGDLARVDFTVPGGDWGVSGSAASRALLQQLIYTATEQAGLRRALITQNGGGPTTIDQLVVDKPLSREDVHGYVAQPLSERISTGNISVPTRATVTHSVDMVISGLARVVIGFTTVGGEPGPTGRIPRLNAEVRPNDDVARPAHGKYSLVLQIDGIEGAASSTAVDGTPLRAIHFTPGTNTERTATYELALDDLRPWRVVYLRGPARVVIDIGGHPVATALNTVVYSPQPGATVSRDITVSGLARAFEATVSWRLRDSAGREVAKGFTTASEGSSPVWGTYEFQALVPANVSGNVTLEVYQASARDGSDTNKVAIPLQVR